jgi:hypothetical protein
MSNPVRMPQNRLRFVLRVPPPIRALVLAATCSLVGAVLVVIWLSLGWPTLVGVLAVVVFVVGLALAVAAQALAARSRTTLLLDGSALTVVSGARRRVLAWTDIDDVTLEPARMIIRLREGRQQVVLVGPRQQNSPQFTDLVAALRARLDASRGYRAL